MLRLAPSPPLPSVDGARRSFNARGLAGLGVLATIGLNSLITGCASAPAPPPTPAPSPGALRPAPSGSIGGHFGALPPALTPEAAARELVAQALLLVGSPYRWGGSRAESGFDCSGLIRYVFAESLQWRLPGSAREQFRVGQEVDRDSLLPAVLLFFFHRRQPSVPCGFVYRPATLCPCAQCSRRGQNRRAAGPLLVEPV